MRVKDVMTQSVVTVGPDERIEDVAKQITKRHISGVFVTEDGKLLGKISHSDVLAKIFPSYEEFYDDLVHSIDYDEIEARSLQIAGLKARDVMTEEVHTAQPDTHVMKVAAWMLLKDVHRLAVVDDSGKLLGVVSRGDIFYNTINLQMAGKAGGRTKAKARSKVKA